MNKIFLFFIVLFFNINIFANDRMTRIVNNQNFYIYTYKASNTRTGFYIKQLNRNMDMLDQVMIYFDKNNNGLVDENDPYYSTHPNVFKCSGYMISSDIHQEVTTPCKIFNFSVNKFNKDQNLIAFFIDNKDIENQGFLYFVVKIITKDNKKYVYPYQNNISFNPVFKVKI